MMDMELLTILQRLMAHGTEAVLPPEKLSMGTFFRGVTSPSLLPIVF
jgi:hypothetical protein